MPETKQARKSATRKQSQTSPKNRATRGPLAPDRIAAILKGLDEAYPGVRCALTYTSP